MLWAFLIIGTILAVELFLFLPLRQRATALRRLVAKISTTIGSEKISDHWKERVLLVYSGQLFSSSVLLFVFIVLALSPFFVLAAVGSATEIAPMFLGFLASLKAIVASMAVGAAYVAVRQRLTKARANV
ncbi:MAG: hypothetical protein AAGC56_09055 [Pseudomonadota bacterium]